MRSQRHDFSPELREHTIPLFETVYARKEYKLQLVSYQSCSELNTVVTDLHTTIRHHNILEMEVEYVPTSPQYAHRSFYNMLFQEPSLRINGAEIFDHFEITGTVPEYYSFALDLNETYQNFSYLSPVLSKNLEFYLVGVISKYRIVLCTRSAQIVSDEEHILIDFFVHFTQQQLRFLNYILEYYYVATLRPYTACILYNDFVFDDYIEQFIQITFGDRAQISGYVQELYAEFLQFCAQMGFDAEINFKQEQSCFEFNICDEALSPDLLANDYAEQSLINVNQTGERGYYEAHLVALYPTASYSVSKEDYYSKRDTRVDQKYYPKISRNAQASGNSHRMCPQIVLLSKDDLEQSVSAKPPCTHSSYLYYSGRATRDFYTVKTDAQTISSDSKRTTENGRQSYSARRKYVARKYVDEISGGQGAHGGILNFQGKAPPKPHGYKSSRSAGKVKLRNLPREYKKNRILNIQGEHTCVLLLYNAYLFQKTRIEYHRLKTITFDAFLREQQLKKPKYQSMKPSQYMPSSLEIVYRDKCDIDVRKEQRKVQLIKESKNWQKHKYLEEQERRRLARQQELIRFRNIRKMAREYAKQNVNTYLQEAINLSAY